MKTVYSLQSTVYRIAIFLFSVFCQLSTVNCLAYVTAEQEPITCQADKIEYSEDGKDAIASGNVRVTYKDIKLTCDRLKINTETKDTYAYGNVVLTEEENKLIGENLIYNLDTKKGSLDNGDLSSPVWYGKGKKISKISDNEFEINKGYITTCDPGQPHCADYRISSQKINIALEDRVWAKNVIFWVGKIPLLYLPFYSYSLKDNRPHIRVIPGHSKEWGTFVKSASRFNIGDGEGHILLDYYERKGIGEGVDYKYTSEFGEGELDTYYIYERDRLKAEEEPAEIERYKLELKHHYEIDEDTDLRFEYHSLRDAEFNKDYFYSQYEQQSQPESYLSLVHSPGSYILSAKVKKQVNDFFTVTEQLPELKFDLSESQLGESNFYFQNQSSFNNFYRKYKSRDAAGENIPREEREDDKKAWRLDTYNQLSYQITDLWNWLDVVPYVGTRQTYYNRDSIVPNRDPQRNADLLRGIYYSGLDLSTRFYRMYDFKSDFWGIEINKLKHIIKPKASYNYIRQPNFYYKEGDFSPSLYEFDSIDNISGQNAITLTLENILQTKRKVRKFSENEDLSEIYPLYNIEEEEAEKIVNLANLTISTNFYMHTQRKSRADEGHQISDIRGELDLNPYDWLNINTNTTYDSYARGVAFKNRFKTVNIDITAKGERWDFTLGNRYQRAEYDSAGARTSGSCELSAELNYALNSLWKIGIYERYDLIKQKNWGNGGYSAVHGYRIVHELPCWIVELNYDFKRLDAIRRQNNSTIWLIFRIKALPESAVEMTKT